MEKSFFYHSYELSHFNFGLDHPFKPERAVKTLDLCNRYGVINHPWMTILEPEPLDSELLLLFHRPDLIEALKKISRGELSTEMFNYGLGTHDNPALPGIFDWSLKAAGATHQAMENILNNGAGAAFNPLGGFHHAFADHVQGFCYLNDINIAILDALRKVPDIKIAYIDCDAHHGNGVQEAFYQDPRVLVISIHETGRTLYPWAGWETEIGEGRGKGFNINLPLEPWSDDEVYALAFDTIVSPIIKSFSPDIIVAQLGADTLISDPLTHLKLTNNGYQRTVRIIRELCPKVIALGGGGYDLYRTARCWTLAWAILNEVVPVDEFVGLVGGMMFGPEMEVGSLHDFPYLTEGENKETALREINRVISYLKETVFPLHGI
jgi:acetoin utilization protein AcuC